MTDSFLSCCSHSQERSSHTSHTAYDDAPEERMKLSQYLNDFSLSSPTSLKSLSLDFSHKSIDEIDFIISQNTASTFLNYQTLIGNSNYLASLRNIEQFQELQKLSLADNEIEDIENIYYLGHLSHLSELNLAGNPITEHSAYKNIVIMLLPNLKSLDSEVITEDMRKAIPQAIRSNFEVLEQLLSKQLQIIKLESIIGRLKVHQSLCMTDLRFRLNYTHFDSEKYTQIIDLSHHFDESFKIWLQKNLLKTLKIESAKAFTSKKLQARGLILLSKQSEIITKLTKDLERASSYLSDLTKNSLNISNIRNTVESKSDSESQSHQSFYSLNMDGEAWETCQSSEPVTLNLGHIKNQEPEVICEQEIECSFNETPRIEALNMAKPGTPSFRLDFSKVSESDLETSNLSHQGDSVWQDIASKYQGDAQSGQKAVFKDSEIQLKDLVLNSVCSTAEKNKDFKRRTIKQKENKSSRREYEAIIDIINKESLQVQALEKQIQGLKDLSRQLETENYTLYQENRGLLEYKAIVEEDDYTVKQEERADEIYKMRMVQQAFYLLRYSIKCSKEVKKIEGKVVARRKLQLEKICFDILVRNRKILKAVKAREIRTREYLLRKSFDGLKRVLIQENRLRAEKEKKATMILKGCFKYWKDDYVKMSQRKKEQSQRIERFILGKSFQTAIKVLKKSARITKRLQEIAKISNNTLIKKHFGLFKNYISEKRNLKDKEQEFRKKREVEKMNNAWISWVVLEQKNRIAEEVVLKQIRKNKMRRALEEWKQKIQKDHKNKESLKELQRQRDKRVLSKTLGKLKDHALENIRKKYKDSCEELRVLKEESCHKDNQDQILREKEHEMFKTQQELKRIVEEYSAKLQEYELSEQNWVLQERDYQAKENSYKEKEALYQNKDHNYALLEEIYQQKDLQNSLREQEWQTQEDLHKAREEMLTEREDALKNKEENLMFKEDELVIKEQEYKQRDLENAIKQQEFLIKEELFKATQAEYDKRDEEYIEKEMALKELEEKLAQREKEILIKEQEYMKKEENIMKKQIGLVQVKKEVQEAQTKNEEEYQRKDDEYMKKEEEWALKAKEYAIKEVLYGQKEEEIMKKDQENAMISEKYNELKVQYKEREALFLQIRDEIQQVYRLKEEEYEGKIDEYAQKEERLVEEIDEYERKIKMYQEKEQENEEKFVELTQKEQENCLLKEVLESLKQQYIESSDSQIAATNAILEEMEIYKQDLQVEKEAKEALISEKESLTQEIAALNEGKERQEMMIQQLEELCMKLREAVTIQNNIKINTLNETSLGQVGFVQINTEQEGTEVQDLPVERDLNKELEGLENESVAYEMKKKLEESKREMDQVAKLLSTDHNSNYGPGFTSQTEGDLREYIHILDFSRQKSEEGSLVYFERPTFDPQNINTLGSTIKSLDEFEGMRSPADSGKIQRRNNKENLLGSPKIELFNKKAGFIKTGLEDNLVKHSRNNSSQWQSEVGSHPLSRNNSSQWQSKVGLLSRKSSNVEIGVIRKDVGKIKMNKKTDPIKNIESLKKNTQSIYDEIQQKARRRQNELRYNL